MNGPSEFSMPQHETAAPAPSSIGASRFKARSRLGYLLATLAVTLPLAPGCSGSGEDDKPADKAATPVVSVESNNEIVSLVGSLALWAAQSIWEKSSDQEFEMRRGEIQTDLVFLQNTLGTTHASLSQRVQALSAQLSDKTDAASVRTAIEGIIAELEQEFATKSDRAASLETRRQQIDRIFGFTPTVTPSPLLRTSIDGNPQAHPLIVKWAKLLTESETHRVELIKLKRIYKANAPEMQTVMANYQRMQQAATELHKEVAGEMATQLLGRTKLLETRRSIHPSVKEFDANIASLAWLMAITQPAKDGAYRGTLEVPTDVVGPAGSDILAAFELAGTDTAAVVPMYRLRAGNMPKLWDAFDPSMRDYQKTQILSESAAPIVLHEKSTRDVQSESAKVLQSAETLKNECKKLDEVLRAFLVANSNLHPTAVAMTKRKAELLKAVDALHTKTDTLLNRALRVYVENLKTQRPQNIELQAFNSLTIEPLQALEAATNCFDSQNVQATEETWQTVVKLTDFPAKIKAPASAAAPMPIDSAVVTQVEKLRIGNASERRHAAEALAQMEKVAISSVTTLRENLNDADASVAVECAVAICKITQSGDKEAIDTIKRCLKADGTEGNLYYVLRASGNSGVFGKDLLESLKEIAENKTGTGKRKYSIADRMYAIEAIGKITPSTNMLPMLKELIGETEAIIRIKAIEAVGKMKPDDAKQLMSLLIDLLGDSNSSVREAAAVALGSIGPEALPAIQRLKACLDDRENSVKWAAEAALKKIHGIK